MGERVSGEKIKRYFKISIGNRRFLILGNIPEGASLEDIVAIVMDTIKGIKGKKGVDKDDGKSQPIQIVIQDLVIQIIIDLGLGDVIHDGEKGKAIKARISEVAKRIDTEGCLEGILDIGGI